MSRWIKAGPGEGGALCAIESHRGTKVWIYLDGEEKLIGYGSIGPERIKIRGQEVSICTIPYFGIATEFQRKPEGADKSCRYARRIFQGLINWVKKAQYPDLYLYVDPENKKALEKFYPDFGFSVFSTEIDEKCPDRTWVLMRKDFTAD